MHVLVAIWSAAVILASAALLWMTSLILLRFLHERRETQRRADRRLVEQALVGVLQGRHDIAAELGRYRHRGRLLAEVLLDFITIVRGADRQIVVEALESFGADYALRARVTRGSLAGRLSAVEALGAFSGAATRAALHAAADRGPANLRLAALRSLIQAGGTVTVGTLLDDVAGGVLPLSGPLAELLQLTVEADHAAAGQALGRTDLPPAARILLLDALGLSGDYELIPLLTGHLASPRGDIRAAAVRALGKMKHPSSGAALGRALGDPDWDVRSAAAQAIGDARLTGLLDDLAQGLADPVWRVRFDAAAALVKFGPPGLERLRDAAAGSNDAPRRAAALTLAELGSA